jgi:Domain of unknown function (DUF5979)
VSSVRIGAYSLEVATLGGSFAQFETEPETENAQALETALEEEAGKPPAAIAAIEHFEEKADDVTGRVEQADKLLRTAAAGDLLQLDNVTGEVDALLDLFSRLDRAGRFEEELKLMRSLNGLLALTLRWLDLIRSLRSLLRSAKAANHAAGQAYAHHELGSLHLCAGRTEAAEHHLREAYRLQSQIGDLTGQCATRHNLDSARRDALARGVSGPRPHRLRTAIVAATFALLFGGGGTALGLAIRGGGGGGTTANAKLIVHKDFIPNAARSVTISVTCTNGGRPDSSSKTATEAAPAVFAIGNLGTGTTCTATEGKAPAGYSKVQADCRDVSIAVGKTRSCTITNRRRGVNSATLTVHQDFAPNAPRSSVLVSVTCTNGGRPDKSSKRATENAPAQFTITRFTEGATCSATESQAQSGYSTKDLDCRNRSIARGSAISCTIFTTRGHVASAVFKVAKDFSDNNLGSVNIDLTCTSGNVAKTAPLASERSPAAFTITAFSPGTTCTASEGSLPSGYLADASDCQRKAIADGGSVSCTIINTTSTTLTVRKDFTDNNPARVFVRLECTSGTIEEASLPASIDAPAVFSIKGFDAGATCTATEAKVPPGYSKDESKCLNVPLVAQKECTIVNSPPG